MPTFDTDFLSVEQAARELKITGRAVRHRIAAGKIAAHKLGPATSAYIIDRAEVERVRETSAA